MILLGASNIARGLPPLIDSARRLAGGPVELFAALGHGRSYGSWSSVAVRSLPGIMESAIWSALKSRAFDHSQEPAALVSDVGNDIIYGRSPAQLIQWVRGALERLQNIGARVGMTALPLDSIARVPRWQVKLIKAISYRGRGPDLDAIFAAARETDARLRELAVARGALLIEQSEDWYGFDPIHIRRSRWPEASASLLAPLFRSAPSPAQGPLSPASTSLIGRLSLRTALPAHCRIAGFEFHRPQPARTLADGTAVHLY